MHKIYAPLIFGYMAIFFTSCKKEIVAGNNNQTVLISVPSSSWQTADGNSYRVSLYIPEITSYFNDTGEVLVYLSYNDGTFEQIPEVNDNISYSFTHHTGNVTVYAEELNGRMITPPPMTNVKIVLVPSSY
jgi:hypothetical protein